MKFVYGLLKVIVILIYLVLLRITYLIILNKFFEMAFPFMFMRDWVPFHDAFNSYFLGVPNQFVRSFSKGFVLSLSIMILLIPYSICWNFIDNLSKKPERDRLLKEEYEKRLIEEQERKLLEEKENEKSEWEEQLRRKVKEEKKLLKVRNKAMMETYKNQIDLMIKYKEEGANIDKEIIAMRENLLAMENQENETMIKNLMDTLNGL